MGKLEERAVAIVKELFLHFEKLEFRATIGDTSRAIEFFIWRNGEKQQCYELAENGEIDEARMELLFDDYATYFRTSDEYKKGTIGKLHFVVE